MSSGGEHLVVASASMRVRCPRCGYDQRGAIAMWCDSCPLIGRCTECGLDWQWAELLSDKVRKPSWCVEYAPHWWAVPWRSIKTLAMTFWPWGFWKSLKMWHEPRWARIAIHLLFLLLLLYCVLMAIHSLIVWSDLDSPRGMGMCTTLQALQSTAHSFALPLSSRPFFPAAVPATYGGTCDSMQVFKNYWSTGLDSMNGVDMFLLKGIARREALLFWGTTTLLLCPVGFVALPVSRRIAKVRWSHIVRLTLYSLPIVGLPVVVGSLAIAGVASFHVSSIVEFLMGIAGRFDWLPWIFLLIWWAVGTRHYLKMDHAIGVGLAVVVMAAMAALAVLCLVVLLAVPWK